MMCLRELSWGVLALLVSTSLAWADPVAQVVKLSGNVEVTRGAASAPLVLGAALEPGDRLKTDASSRVRVQLIDGSIINLGSESELSIENVVSAGPGTDRQVGLDLWLGALRAFAAPATSKSRFEIRTPRAITAVRGTEWGILANAVQSDVLVLSGRVGVRKNEVSGVSATTLTRTLGVTVTDQGLGQITRWNEAQVAALMAATEVPGPERGFDLGTAPALDLAPAAKPVAPDNEQGKSKPGKQNCPDPDTFSCKRRDRDRGQTHEHDNDNNHEHDSNGGNT
ncbi:MAG: FecR domain-containing protein [Rhodospirillaceae bacterium]|nr:FecR domain-containing protein [Rhodospirillaceae bacterium]